MSADLRVVLAEAAIVEVVAATLNYPGAATEAERDRVWNTEEDAFKQMHRYHARQALDVLATALRGKVVAVREVERILTQWGEHQALSVLSEGLKYAPPPGAEG